MKIVNDNECDIDCGANESNTTTSNNRMIMRIMTSVSQKEIEKCSKRTKFEMAGAIRYGHILNQCTFGFRRKVILKFQILRKQKRYMKYLEQKLQIKITLL